MDKTEKLVFMGNMAAPILETHMKIIAWSKEMRKEIGCGFETFIITSKGDYFADEKTRVKIISHIQKLPLQLHFIPQIRELQKRLKMEIINNNRDDEIFVKLLIKNFMFYYLARREGELLFEIPEVSKQIKEDIEHWRNKEDFFDVYGPWYEQVAKNLSLTSENIQGYTLDEFEKVIQGKEIKLDPRREKGPWSLVLEKDRVTCKYRIIKQQQKQEDITQGQVTGTVVYSVQEKIKGIVGKEIMVVPFTSPDLVPMMETKKAIITNEGGLLCHAAITCREFKVPCIVGTKNATKVFKDGDYVEVDTKKGLVRKIRS